jgi:crossover junction endodeoxyribonuclease RuvC
MNQISIGIDPGKDGGIGFIVSGAEEAFPYSDEVLIHEMRKVHLLKKEYGSDVQVRLCLEKVGAMPKQGVASMFNFGKSAGFVEGVLQAFEIPYQLVPSQTWKKEFSLIGKDKKESVQVCKKLFPGVNLLATPRCKKEHDGMAEALLMAEYARRKL